MKTPTERRGQMEKEKKIENSDKLNLIKWTPDQQNAIKACTGELLVSAAAGSGKTAVLVERVINLLTRENNPITPDELLVVTFTNAAAAEMKVKIAKRLGEYIDADPGNYALNKVLMSLDDAQISTTDSFCIKLVRENAGEAGVSPDFKVIGEGDELIAENAAMSATLEQFVAEYPEKFSLLNKCFGSATGSESVAEIISNIYDTAMSHPFPEKWIDKLTEEIDENADLNDTPDGKTVLEYALKLSDSCVKLAKSGISVMKYDEEVENKYYDSFVSAVSLFSEISEALGTLKRDGIKDYLSEIKLESLPKIGRGFGAKSNPVTDYCQKIYKGKLTKYLEEIKDLFQSGNSENISDAEAVRPVKEALSLAVKMYAENLFSIKSEKNEYYFSDILSMAVKLLVDENGKRTKTADMLSERYKAVLVDEYQDTNETQDIIYTTVGGDNLFMVGDVKQSIYSFRLALPEIFVDKYNMFSDYDGKKHPSKIFLSKNFRSRKGVLDSVNFIFSKIMSPDIGGVGYGENEKLKFGGGYDGDSEKCSEIITVKTSLIDDEAKAAAKRIDDMIKSGFLITDHGEKRKAKPSDFCILFRSDAGGKVTDAYTRALSEYGIEARGEQRNSLFDVPEVEIFISLLRVTDNPSDDVSLISVMMSPLYGFTPDELADLRIKDRNAKIYSVVKKEAENGNKKCLALINDIGYYRDESESETVDLFVRNLLDETGIMSVVSAMKEPETRKLNLLNISALADDFSAKGSGSLGGFVRYLRQCEDSSVKLNAATSALPGSNVVSMMTIHKSKGLEFPVVILADASKKINKQDLNGNIIINSKYGVGMKRIEPDFMKKYPTNEYLSSKIHKQDEIMSEEMRILYVALTRAKEKIIVMIRDGSTEKKQSGTVISPDSETEPVYADLIKADSYSSWINAAINSNICDRKEAAELFDIKTVEPEKNGSADEEETYSEPDEKIIAEIKRRAEYVYPYSYPENVRPKAIASDFENSDSKLKYIGESKPSFMMSGGFNPAMAGTINHKFMENIDFCASDAKSELERMKNENIFTSEEASAVRLGDIDKFLAGNLNRRIINSEKVSREREFTCFLSLKELGIKSNKNVEDEKILIEGKVDLIFIEGKEAVIVDWKTDRGKTRQDFVDTYSGQLKVYALAAEKVLGIKVKELIVYSLSLGEEIEITV